MKIFNIQYPISNIKYLVFLFFVLCSLFFVYLQWSPSFADPDSFFHTKVAVLMSKEGFIKSFPWLQFAHFSQNFTDQHFLYHLFLSPFVTVFPPLLGVKIAAILFAVFFIIFFYFFLRRWQIRWPFFYLLLLLSIPPFVFRLNLAKTGPLSLMVLLVALSLIWQKRYLSLGILSFFYVWLYGGWILLIILTTCSLAAELMIKRPLLKNGQNFQFPISPDEISGSRPKRRDNFQTIFKFLISNFKKNDWKILAAVSSGITAGLVINPYFPHNLQFYWEQVVQIGLLNYQDIIPVGMEWYPFKILDFIAANAFALMLTLAAFSAFFYKIQRIPKSCVSLFAYTTQRFQKILTLFLFSGFLAVMTLKSQRFIEYFAPFFILANAFLLDFSLPANFSPKASLKKFFSRNLINKIIVIYLLAVWLIFFIGKGIELRHNLTRQFNWSYLKGASEWLKNNTASRSLIFHSGWSDFPMLFYHNDHNVYLAGMDPTFFYRYNSELYKKWDRIIRAQEPQMAEIIKKDFGTNFILIKPSEKPFLEMVEKNAQFVLRYEDEEARVFEIK